MMPLAKVILGLLAVICGITLAVVLLVYVVVPICRGIGWSIAGLFKGIGFLISHIFEFIAGMIGDVMRMVGTVFAMVALIPLALLNVLIGRWSAAGHFAASVKREFMVAGKSLYRLTLQRPLRLLFLDGLLEGVEQRVPEAMAAAPGADKPSKRTGQFDGYTIIGSLKAGGSGAKLYVARPDDDLKRRYQGMPDVVVIKSFALAEGSSLPQIVRESRALECAKSLGLVFEHGMDDKRFYYVMPYHDGDHLGLVTRQLHGETDSEGLAGQPLRQALGYACDLVATLDTYHRGGLWHKDVKPDNIIIHDGRAHLVDLGLVTPLASAMTLTTHGTEYFRDPEMVRQALRGVKVHQVDGAKFDVYAAGAVLYFMLENDFPAHGALSRFSRRSPEAVKWIVRRAMADYTHRYGSAADLLADLRAVATSDDPFTLKPAALPSMNGGAAAPAMAHDDVADHQDDPVDDLLNGVGAVAGAAAAAAGLPVAKIVNAVPVAKTGRPRLRVANWWTGEYQTEDGVAMDPAAEREMRQAAADLRHEAAAIRGEVDAGRQSPRKAAKEQVRSARARAREMRARTRRCRTRHERPSAMLGGLTLLAIVAAIGGVAISQGQRDKNSVSTTIAPEVAVSQVIDASELPLLLLTSDVGDPSAATIDAIDAIVAGEIGQGREVIIDADIAGGAIGELFDLWYRDRQRNPEMRMALEEALRLHELAGVLHVTAASAAGDGDDLRSAVILASGDAPVAAPVAVPAPTPPVAPVPMVPAVPEGAYLLLNDHPAKSAPAIQAELARLRSEWRANGLVILEQDDVEQEARVLLPTGKIDGKAAISARLASVLEQHDLDGIIYVTASDGDGPASERLAITILR